MVVNFWLFLGFETYPINLRLGFGRKQLEESASGESRPTGS